MKLLMLLGGAAALATAPLLRDGSASEETASSCCSTEASCGAEGATLASATSNVVAQPNVVYDPAATGSISIHVKVAGDVPDPLPPLVIDAAKSEGCEGSHAMPTEDRGRIVAKDGSVANVVVSVEIEGEELVVPDAPITVDQRGCRFEPHIAVVPVGAQVQFNNSDPINHNVHTFSRKNPALNRNIAGGSKEMQKMEKDEVIEVKCDIHPWMKSWVVVLEDHRMGVTGTDGKVSLDGLPPGTYKVSYWHETLGKGKSEEVTVAAGAAADLAISLGETSSGGGRGRRRR